MNTTTLTGSDKNKITKFELYANRILIYTISNTTFAYL